MRWEEGRVCCLHWCGVGVGLLVALCVLGGVGGDGVAGSFVGLVEGWL